MQEDNFVRKTLLKVCPNYAGFADKHGPDAAKQRNLFQQFFHYDKMKMLVPLMKKMINEGLDELIEINQISKDEFTKVDLSKVFYNIMCHMGRLIIFGGENYSSHSPEIEITNSVDSIVHMCTQIGRTNPLIHNFLSIFIKFPFLSPLLTKINSTIEQHKFKISQYIDQRSGEGLNDKSAMDRIIAHNQKCMEDGKSEDAMSRDEIMGALNLMIFAAYDTTQNMAVLNICLLAERQDIREKVSKIAGEIFDKDGSTTADIIDSHEELTMYIKEAFRLENPSASKFVRVAIKDTKIKDITVRKGDCVGVFFAPLVLDEKYFPDANNFQYDRFSKQNEMKNSYPKFQVIPFGIGERACLGKNLGELMSKLFITAFCRRFEFKKPDGVDYYDRFDITRFAENPYVDAKLK